MHKIEKINISDLIKLNIELPNIQRIYDNDKINEIVDYQEKYFKANKTFNFLGVICINVLDNDSVKKYYLIDGQHRYYALIKLMEKGYCDLEIFCEWVPIDSIDKLRENYMLINKNTPLPDFSDDIDKNIVGETFLYFEKKYNKIFKNSGKTNRPHINKNNFQEAIAFIVENLNIDNTMELIDMIEGFNNNVKNWKQDDFPKSNTITDNMIKMCNEIDFYLGLFIYKGEPYGYDWVKDLIKIKTGKIVKNLPKDEKNKKVKIPINKRQEVWDKWIGNMSTSKCFCCRNNEIKIANFEVGHVIAEANGGTLDVKNLRPICSACNTSMGTTHMEEYMGKNYPEYVKYFNISMNKYDMETIKEKIASEDKKIKKKKKWGIF
jgi:hypothetical protein